MTYEEIGTGIGKLVTEKQKQYGDSFTKAGQIMQILYGDGIPIDAMGEALTVVRVLDKLNRIATACGRPDLGGESPWRDIAGYALLELGKPENVRKET
jgi:hypothetical protein